MTSSPPASNVAAALAADRLGIGRITQFALCAAAPLTVVAGVIPTGYATTGIVGIPAAFVLLGIVLFVFAVGYNAMSRRISNAGTFYAYIAQGVGRPAGVAAAWVATFAYNLLQVGLYGIFGANAGPLLDPVLGVTIPWWGYALIAWAVVAILGLLRVDVNGLVLGVLMAVEVVVILVFDVADTAHPAGGHLSVTAFAPNHLLVSGIGALLVIAVTGFVGFETAPFYSEEAKDARRTVPAATYLCIGAVMVLYAFSAWAETVAVGPDRISAVAGQQQSEMVFTIAGRDLGATWATVGHALLLTSVFAAMISYHNSAGRYLFSLGREGVLPTWFGRTVVRTGAPLWGSLSQTIIGVLVIAGYALGGLDPMVNLFYWLGTSGGFGVLLLLAVTSLAVIGYFRRTRDETAWRAVVAPAIALVLLVAAIVLSVVNFAVLLGVDPSSPARWAFPAAYLVIILLGLGYALRVRRRSPSVYGRIGQGMTVQPAGRHATEAVL